MWLKQSTAATVKMGPFLDSTDGNTTEEALAIAQADIRLSKNGGAFAQTNNAAGATHDENGWYGVPLNTTDTNTLGTLVVAIHEAGALAVWGEFMVVSANTWDSFFAAENLDVNAVEISGDSAAANNAELAFDGTGYGFTACTMPTTTTVTNQVTADVTAISGDAVAANNLESYCDGTTPQPVNTTEISGDSVAANNLESYCDGTTPQPVNATEISGDSAAANNAELAFDGTGYGFIGCTMPTTTAVTNQVTADTTQIEGADATDQINAACDASIETYNLDHLLSLACPGNVITGAVVDNSVIAILAAIGGDISDYADASDSLEALADAIAAISITADLIWDEEMDVNAPGACNTAREYLNVLIAALAGKTAGTGDWSARDLGDTKTRIQGTLSDAGARSSVDTLDGT